MEAQFSLGSADNKGILSLLSAIEQVVLVLFILNFGKVWKFSRILTGWNFLITEITHDTIVGHNIHNCGPKFVAPRILAVPDLQ